MAEMFLCCSKLHLYGSEQGETQGWHGGEGSGVHSMQSGKYSPVSDVGWSRSLSSFSPWDGAVSARCCVVLALCS